LVLLGLVTISRLLFLAKKLTHSPWLFSGLLNVKMPTVVLDAVWKNTVPFALGAGQSCAAALLP
jgi:hypothetical protein